MKKNADVFHINDQIKGLKGIFALPKMEGHLKLPWQSLQCKIFELCVQVCHGEWSEGSLYHDLRRKRN